MTDITFMDLIRKHFKGDPYFNLEEFLMNYHDSNYMKDTLKIHEILPGSIRVLSNISGRKAIQIYCYKTYYIIYEYIGASINGRHRLDSLRIQYQPNLTYSDISHFYNKHIKVFLKKNFNYYRYLKNDRMSSVDYHIKFFKGLFPIDYLTRLNNYMELQCITPNILVYIIQTKMELKQHFIPEITDIITDRLFY